MDARFSVFRLARPPQRGRQDPPQIVALEIQPGHATARIRGHAVPFAQRPGTQPVGPGRPVRPARPVVKRRQAVPLRIAAMNIGAQLFDPAQPFLKCLGPGHAHLGFLEPETLERETGELYRQGSGQFGESEEQFGEPGQLSQFAGYLPGQRVITEDQSFKIGELPKLGRDGSRQPVLLKLQPYEVGKLSQFRGYLSRQVVFSENQIGEVGQISQPGRDRAGQLTVERQRCEPCKISQFGRDRAGHGSTESQTGEVGQIPQLGRDRAGQPALKIQPRQVGEVRQPGRDRAGQPAPEGQPRQVCEVAQLGRNRAGQIVPKPQRFEPGQTSQLRRNRTGQLVPVKFQLRQVSEGAQLDRDRAGQLITHKTEAGDSTVGDRDPMPFADGPVAQPVRIVGPVGAVRRVVQGDQGFPVRIRTPAAAGGRNPTAEIPRKDHEVPESDLAVAVQIVSRRVLCVALPRPERAREIHEIFESDRPVAVEVGPAGVIGV